MIDCGECVDGAIGQACGRSTREGDLQHGCAQQQQQQQQQQRVAEDPGHISCLFDSVMDHPVDCEPSCGRMFFQRCDLPRGEACCPKAGSDGYFYVIEQAVWNIHAHTGGGVQ